MVSGNIVLNFLRNYKFVAYVVFLFIPAPLSFFLCFPLISFQCSMNTQTIFLCYSYNTGYDGPIPICLQNEYYFLETTLNTNTKTSKCLFLDDFQRGSFLQYTCLLSKVYTTVFTIKLLLF